QEQINSLKTLHEEVMDRSGDITDLQRHTLEQTGTIRDSLAASRGELQSAVERFEYEARGLESVSQRVADLRGSLTEFEGRYRDLAASRQTVRDLLSQTEALTPQVRELGTEVSRIDGEARKLESLTRGLDEAARTAESLGARVSRIEEARPTVDGVLKEL